MSTRRMSYEEQLRETFKKEMEKFWKVRSHEIPDILMVFDIAVGKRRLATIEKLLANKGVTHS